MPQTTLETAPLGPALGRKLPLATERRFALGVGLTNGCNLGCAHCYRGTGDEFLSVAEVLRAVDALPTRSVNFGTGESAVHPEFEAIVRLIAGRGVAVTMTTNGYSAAALADDALAQFHDVEFSIDHPDQAEHDTARGPGNWALIEQQMSRCRALGVPTAIVAVMMATNFDRMADLARIAGERGALLRVNVYQAVRSDAFSMSYQQFWRGWQLLLQTADVVACGEPILRAVLGIERAPGAGCGAETVRLTPRGRVLPCVYGSDEGLGLSDLERLGGRVFDTDVFSTARSVPAACARCPALETCRGGCASRRALAGAPDAADPYCPFVRGDRIELHPGAHASERQLPKASSSCTTLLRHRDLPPRLEQTRG